MIKGAYYYVSMYVLICLMVTSVEGQKTGQFFQDAAFPDVRASVTGNRAIIRQTQTTDKSACAVTAVAFIGNDDSLFPWP